MALRITRDAAYAQGKAAGQAASKDNSSLTIAGHNLDWARQQYPATAALDIRSEVIAFDRRRMERDLDLTRFPECRGLRDRVEAERRGFLDACADPFLFAMHFSWGWFVSRILNTRFIGRAPAPAQCTDFWFADTREGGPIHGCNRDDIRERYTHFSWPDRGPGETRFTTVTRVGGVSASVLCDEEPEDWFPVNMDWITPPDIRSLPEHMEFLNRYRDFWGPGNSIFVDPDLRFAAVEKANRRMGVRYSSNGACTITACAYLTPEMSAFKKERDLMSIKARGWTDDCPDARYWDGCERRYRRLLQLVDEENRRGPTLLGSARIALDHAVPFPDRICLAGEKSHPDETLQNWTLTSFARCVSGPNRRMLIWQMDPTKPIPVYQTRPRHLVGDGVVMRPEWERELAEAGDVGGPR